MAYQDDLSEPPFSERVRPATEMAYTYLQPAPGAKPGTTIFSGDSHCPQLERGRGV